MKDYWWMPDRQSRVALLALWSLVALVLGFVDPFWTSVAVSVAIWMQLCVAWNVVGGIVGQVSFGNAAFFGIGAYTTAYLSTAYGINPWLGMVAGALLAVGASVAIGFLPFKWGLSPLVFALFTLAFSYALEYCISGISELGGTNGLYVPIGESGLAAFRFLEPGSFLVVATVILTVLVITVSLLHRSRLGLFWRAVHDNEAAASAAGVHTFAAKISALAISALFTAMAGTLQVQNVGFVDPPSVFGLEITVYILLFAVVGGSGTLLGPLLGPLILLPLAEVLRVKLGTTGASLHHLLFGLALMAAILAWPGGLMSGLARFGIGRGALMRASLFPEVGLEVIGRSGGAAGCAAVRVETLSKSFGGVQALRDVSFAIAGGEILGIIGPNGAGKTTLFSILSGFNKPSSGKVYLLDEELSAMSPQTVCARGVARTFQTTQSFPTLTPLECVFLAAQVRNDAEPAARIASGVLRAVGLWDRRETLSTYLTLAEHRRLEIARALATQPQIVLLDEIMAGLTPREVGEAMELIRSIREQGITVVVIEHNVRAVMGVSDRVLVLDAGEVLAIGPPASVARDPRVLEAYLGSVPEKTVQPA